VACPGPISLPSSAIPPAVQGLLLRKENFEIGASYQLAPWQTPIPTRPVVKTGAGPSVMRADMLPRGGPSMRLGRRPELK